MPMITPVLLCGGSGTRLWPLSRKSYPKQFSTLLGDTTLLQATAQRLAGDQFAAPMVLTNSDFRFIVTEQLSEIGIDPGAILIEPEGKNTAPAVLAAALYLEKTDPDGLLLIAPADHVVPDTAAFQAAVMAGVTSARADNIVTFGIEPTHANTAYGYLELGQTPDGSAGPARPLACFVEKPNATQAQDMLQTGNFLWNAGIFLFSVQTILTAYRQHAPDLITPVQAAIEQAKPDLGFLRIAPEPWSQLANISVDCAVMEHAGNLAVIPFAAGWTDLGGWDAVWQETQQDARGVATSGAATALDCDNTLLRSEDDSLQIVGIGLKDIIAVAMPDAVLVVDANRAQDVKLAVAALNDKTAKQAESFPKDHRPWGWFESLVMGDKFQVKRIVVHPGASLSLQSHRRRAEHWIVVEGCAEVTIDDAVQLINENQSIYIPVGARHRLHNPGQNPVILIEVQTGDYFGEDDIARYEDVYARK